MTTCYKQIFDKHVSYILLRSFNTGHSFGMESCQAYVFHLIKGKIL